MHSAEGEEPVGWLRIDDAALSHPKIIGMVDLRRPLDLWIWGLAYAQMHLTDGLIPSEAVPKGTTRAVDELVKRRLWEPDEQGYRIHDHLDWNDPREVVVRRKKKAKDRKQAWLTKQDQNALPREVPERVPNAFQAPERNVTHHHTTPHHTNIKKEREEREDAPSLSESSDPFTDPDVTKRAGKFIDRYQALYQQHRKGARYALRPARDYAAAVTLCQTWTDDVRLDKLAAIFLKTDHKFAEEGSRTIPQFLALASWADSRLGEWEQAHVRAES